MLWFAANFSIGAAFGIIHGFERVDAFWEAPDMDGVPIIGTYIIFVTRTIAAASLVGMIIYIVPRYHKQVAIVAAALVSAAAVGILGFILVQAANADPRHRSGKLVQTPSGHVQHYCWRNSRCVAGIWKSEKTNSRVACFLHESFEWNATSGCLFQCVVPLATYVFPGIVGCETRLSLGANASLAIRRVSG